MEWRIQSAQNPRLHCFRATRDHIKHKDPTSWWPGDRNESYSVPEGSSAQYARSLAPLAQRLHVAP